MAFDGLDAFGRVVAKANLLAERYALLKQKKDEAEAKLAELQHELDQKTLELQKLSQEVEYLRMASVLSPDRDQVESTRAIISGIVREIDRCITDLTD